MSLVPVDKVLVRGTGRLYWELLEFARALLTVPVSLIWCPEVKGWRTCQASLIGAVITYRLSWHICKSPISSRLPWMNESKWDDESRQFQARGGRIWKALEKKLQRDETRVSTFCWNTLVLGGVPSNMRPVNKLKQRLTKNLITIDLGLNFRINSFGRWSMLHRLWFENSSAQRFEQKPAARRAWMPSYTPSYVLSSQYC